MILILTLRRAERAAQNDVCRFSTASSPFHRRGTRCVNQVFKQLAKKLSDLVFGYGQCSPPRSGGTIDKPRIGPPPGTGRAQQTFPLQSMQQWIHCARTEPVAMPPKFFDHLQTENRFFAGVIEDVEPNKAGIQLPMAGFIGMLLQAEPRQID